MTVARVSGVLADRYEVGQLIGAGRTSEVYRVADTVTGGAFALKVLDQRLTWDPAARGRLRREVMISRRVQHPGIARVHDLICWEDRAAVLQELVAGEPLGSFITRDGALDVSRSIDLGIAILDALSAAHERGVVHRDLKPSNILLDGLGHPRLIDFGLARVAMMTTVTHTGAVLGTPGYQAPEVLRGDRADLRADLYGFGLLLFEMLCGRNPYASSERDLQPFRQLFEDAPRVRALRPEVPAGLDALVAELLHRNPEARPAGALEVMERLRSLDGDGDPGTPCAGCGFPARSTIPLCPKCGLPRYIPLHQGRWFVRIRGVEEPAGYARRLADLFGAGALRERMFQSVVAGRMPSVILVRGVDERAAENLEVDAERFGATAECGDGLGWLQLKEEAPVGLLLTALPGALAAGYLLGAQAIKTGVVQSATDDPWAWVFDVGACFVAAMAVIALAGSRQMLRRKQAIAASHPADGLELEESIERRMRSLRGGSTAPAMAVAMDAFWEAWTAACRTVPEDRRIDVLAHLEDAVVATLDLALRADRLEEIVGGRRLHDAARALDAVSARRRATGGSAALDSAEANVREQIDAIEDADRLLGSISGRLVLAAGAFRRLARMVTLDSAWRGIPDDPSHLLASPELELQEMEQLLAVIEQTGTAPAPGTRRLEASIRGVGR